MKIKEALILAGGKGLRLTSVTLDKYPKSLVKIGKNISALEFTVKSLKKIGIENIYIAIGHLKEKITDEVKNPNITFIEEDGPLGTGGAIYNFIIKTGQKKPFLVTPSDHYLNWAELESLVNIQTRDLDSTLAIWFTTKYDSKVIQPGVKNNIWFNKKTLKMTEYLSGAIKKVAKTAKERSSKTNDVYQNVTSMGILIINPVQYIKSVQKLKLNPPYCIYKDLTPIWIYGKGKLRETIKIKVAKTDIIDIGTPERLFLARRLYKYSQIRKPLIIAHGRTVYKSPPTSSTKPLRKSDRLKSDGVEVDVHLTKDSILVVNHHSYLTTKSKKEILIETSNFSKLKLIDKKLTLLEEVLKPLRNKNIKVIIDVKTVSYRCVKKIIQQIKKYQENIIFEIAAKEPLLLRWVKDNFLNIQAGLIIDESRFESWMKEDYVSYYLLNIGKISKVDYLHLPSRILGQNKISRILHKAGFKLHINVTSQVDMEIAKRESVDQLTTEHLVKTIKFFE